MIIEGIAVIARGVPRLTVDVDATVWGADVSIPDLFETLEAHEIVPRVPDAEELARRRQVLLLHGDRLDLGRVRDVMRQFAEALEEPQRVAELEALIQKAAGTRA